MEFCGETLNVNHRFSTFTYIRLVIFFSYHFKTFTKLNFIYTTKKSLKFFVSFCLFFLRWIASFSSYFAQIMKQLFAEEFFRINNKTNITPWRERSAKSQQDYTTRHSRLRKEGEENLFAHPTKLSAAQDCEYKLVIAKIIWKCLQTWVEREKKLSVAERRGKEKLCNEHNHNELWSIKLAERWNVN